MAWCPKCRNEYVDGITTCSDCKCDLVDELEEIKDLKYLNIKDYPNPDEIVDFLHQSGINSAEYCEIELEDVPVRAIGVSPKDYLDTTIHLSVFFENVNNEEEFVDDESTTSSETEDEVDDTEIQTNDEQSDVDVSDSELESSTEENVSSTESKDFATNSSDVANDNTADEGEHERISTYGNSVYVTYADKYEDMKSSAYTLLFVGTIGAVALILRMTNVLNFPIPSSTKWLFYFVFGTMMIGFIIYGYISYKKAAELLVAAEDESTKIEEINDWAKDNFKVDSIDENIDTDTQEELLYFNRVDYIKETLMHEFEDTDEALIDSLIENIYTNLYESEE